jgi:hypothetical protein
MMASVIPDAWHFLFCCISIVKRWNRVRIIFPYVFLVSLCFRFVYAPDVYFVSTDKESTVDYPSNPCPEKKKMVHQL